LIVLPSIYGKFGVAVIAMKMAAHRENGHENHEATMDLEVASFQTIPFADPLPLSS